MELGPIFRSLLYNKGRFWLIAVEIALTLAIVVNCANIILELRSEMNRPTGIDEENILVITSKPVMPAFSDEDYVDAARAADLHYIRQQPGVRHASPMHAVPLSGGGSAAGLKPVGSDLDTVTAPYFVVGRDIVETLGIQIVAGRGFEESDYPSPDENKDEKGRASRESEGEIEHDNILVTRSWADRLFPDGDGLGKQVQNKRGDNVMTIVGIIDIMHNSWPRSDRGEDAILFPGEPGNDRRQDYLVRVEPEQKERLYVDLEKGLLAVNGGRIVRMRTMGEVKHNMYGANAANIQIFTGVIVLLFVVTGLGIVGLTSFSVTQRYRQIGTRRALGATRLAVLRYFLIENWIITGMGLTLGVGLTYLLNLGLASFASAPKVPMNMMIGGVAVYWAVGLLAALIPAVRSMKVSPVVATRTV